MTGETTTVVAEKIQQNNEGKPSGTFPKLEQNRSEKIVNTPAWINQILYNVVNFAQPTQLKRYQ